MLESKMSTGQESLVARTAERIGSMLPYGDQIAQLEQNIGVIAQTLQADILTKVTTLLTENIEAVLPDLPRMKEKIDDAIEDIERQSSGGNKTFNIANKCRDDIEELKGEFDYMKTRFSPQFV